MSTGPLVLWLAVDKGLVEMFQYFGKVPLCAVSIGRVHLGLCEREADALERVGRLSNGRVSATKETHVLLELRFSDAALGSYVRMTKGRDGKYCSVMYKKIFDDEKDHGVWHFHVDVPLSSDPEGLQTIWKEVE